MPEKEFNLLRENWIRVMRSDGTVEELSVLALFREAHRYRGLAGELPTQDAAILRVLLAVLHAVFAVYDPEARFEELKSPDMAFARWKALWDRGAFPYEIIEAYLASFEERFYLFHPERPFFQVPHIGKATEYSSAKLNGALAESANKPRLFPARTGQAKERLTYSEAARWLIHVNAYDDTSGKASVRGVNMPSPGAGWLGKLGLICAIGENIFKTLLLNLVLAPNGGQALWGAEKPAWERDKPRTEERTEIPLPDNLSELYTLQSRRLLLNRDNGSVTGYLLLGGDFIPKENAIVEQMTAWQAKTNADEATYQPRRHAPARQMWRDFPVFFEKSSASIRPGIVNWLAALKGRNFIDCTQFRFQITGVKYGDKDFFADDIISDCLAFHADLLTALGEAWVHRITSEIQAIDLLAWHVGQLAYALAKAAGNDKGDAHKACAKEQAYFRLDLPFRTWLASIDPAAIELDQACNAWWEEARAIAVRLGAELMKSAGPKAFAGRTVKEKNQDQRYTAPEAYNWFLNRTSSRAALKGGKGDGRGSQEIEPVRQAQDGSVCAGG